MLLEHFVVLGMEIARQSDLNINFIAAATVGLSDSCLFVITNYLPSLL